MIILFVKFRSALPPDQVRAIMNERADQFRAIPELHQKYYARDTSTDEWCGVYQRSEMNSGELNVSLNARSYSYYKSGSVPFQL